MRVWAVDASAPDGQSLRGLEPREGQTLPDVILLFGGVAEAAAAAAGSDRQRRDEGFLDAAADWLLVKNGGARAPVRPALAAWLSLARVVSGAPAERFSPLPARERDIELVDTLLLMAVPNRQALEEEALSNAAVWILGGAPGGALEEREGRAVLSPGDFLAGGQRLELELGKGQLRAVVTTPDGKESRRLELALSARTKMSVKG